MVTNQKKFMQYSLFTASSTLVLAVSLVSGSLAVANAATVLPNGNLIDLGIFSSGTYTLTGSGLIDLCGSGNFSMRPDGVPDSPVSCSNYGSYFNPSGSYQADGSLARAGNNAKIGSLIGTLNANAFTSNRPTLDQASDWFLIGYSSSVTLPSTGHIYASVNDTFYSNNTGSFDVQVQRVSALDPQQVPESSPYKLMTLGLVAILVRSYRRILDNVIF
jgi:hypothetical protein